MAQGGLPACALADAMGRAQGSLPATVGADAGGELSEPTSALAERLSWW